MIERFILIVSFISLLFESNFIADRKWRDLRVVKEVEYHLLFPALVKLSPDGKFVYVLDYGDLKIKRFASDGRFLNEYGKGKGEGPGEFKNPTDFAIDGNYNVWVCDPENGLVTVFDESGKVFKTMRLKTIPLRLELVGEKFLVTKPIVRGDYLVEVYDTNGNFKFGLGENLSPEYKDVLFGGWMDSDGEILYYGFERLSYILSFDLNERKIRYMNKTIDEFPDPKIEVFSIEGRTIRGLPKDAPFSIMSLNVKNGLIFVRSGANWRKREDITIVDVYKASDGRYLYSFKVPIRMAQIYCDGNFIYGVSDTMVVKLKLNFK
jgi:hypothetical protein